MLAGSFSAVSLIAQTSLGLDTRPALVEGVDGNARLLCERFSESLGGFCLGSLSAVHVTGQSDYGSTHVSLDDQIAEVFEVRLRRPALKSARGKGERRLCIGKRESDAFLTKIDAENPHGGGL